MKIEPGPYRVASEKASSSETARATKSQHKSACAGPTPARFDSQEIDKAAKLYTVVQRDPLCIREVLRLRPRTPMGSVLSYRRACAQEHQEWPCAIQSVDVGGQQHAAPAPSHRSLRRSRPCSSSALLSRSLLQHTPHRRGCPRRIAADVSC
jgi:hypothetical protein